VHDVRSSGPANYGHANIGQDIEPTDSTLFFLASVSKTVVAVALMQLWEDGRFGLDDNINLYLPWSVRHPFFPTTPITFRMLMTHTSSIKDNWNVLDHCTRGVVILPSLLGIF